MTKLKERFKKRFTKERIKQFLRYMMSGTVAAFIDYGLFLLFYYVLLTNLPNLLNNTISTWVARIISSVVNYEINRRFVFGAKAAKKSYILKYCVVWLGQVGLSILFTYAMDLLGVAVWVTKFIADQVLGFTGYQAQLHWVFKDKKPLTKKEADDKN